MAESQVASSLAVNNNNSNPNPISSSTIITTQIATATGPTTVESKHDRHMRVMTERLTRIEQDTQQARPAMYSQKLSQLKQEMTQIQLGTHQEFQYRLSQLDRDRQLVEEKARLWRQYQTSLAEQMYKSECESIELEYRQEKEGLKERILQQIEERRRKIREERDQLSIESAIIQPSSTIAVNNPDSSANSITSGGGGKGNQRKSVRKRMAGDQTGSGSGGGSGSTVLDARARKRQMQGPITAPLLKESEIMEDFVILSKFAALPSMTGKKTTTKRRTAAKY